MVATSSILFLISFECFFQYGALRSLMDFVRIIYIFPTPYSV
jgi:hypothetical protein